MRYPPSGMVLLTSASILSESIVNLAISLFQSHRGEKLIRALYSLIDGAEAESAYRLLEGTWVFQPDVDGIRHSSSAEHVLQRSELHVLEHAPVVFRHVCPLGLFRRENKILSLILKSVSDS